MPPSTGWPVLCAVVCAAPPARQIHIFARAAQAAGWSVHLVATPDAATWFDTDYLAHLTGHRVQIRQRHPDESRDRPADALAVVPATFNTVNKWAAGISDNLALNLLNEALALRLPTVVAPYSEDNLTAHPAFDRSVRLLTEHGAIVLPTNILRPAAGSESFTWTPVLDALPTPGHHDHDGPGQHDGPRRPDKQKKSGRRP